MSFTFIIGALVAYLLGSIPSGLWIGQYFFQKDIRKFGSGNLGSTNAFRVLGKKAGSVVLFCDVFKGFLAMILAMTVFKQDSLSPLWIASFAVIGHTFPLFASFKGGKAVNISTITTTLWLNHFLSPTCDYSYGKSYSNGHDYCWSSPFIIV